MQIANMEIFILHALDNSFQFTSKEMHHIATVVKITHNIIFL